MMLYLSFVLGVIFGIFVISICRAASRSDYEAKIYALRRELETLRYEQREIALKDTD